MAQDSKPTAQADKLNGLFVRGVVMSSTAKAHKRKDGTGVFVIARHELALQPGLAVWEEFHEPLHQVPLMQVVQRLITSSPSASLKHR
jgi:hypothetical protein